MTERLRRGAALALLACSQGAALAQVSETLERKLYDVRVAPGADLLEALNRATPIWRGGQAFHGHTAWHVNWQLRHARRPDGQCGVTTVQVRLHVTMTLPDLKEAPADIAAQFARYAAALDTHEEGHRRVGRIAADQVHSALLARPPAASCQQLEAEADRAAHDVVERAKRKDQDYDRDTQHGCTQGACLSR